MSSLCSAAGAWVTADEGIRRPGSYPAPDGTGPGGRGRRGPRTTIAETYERGRPDYAGSAVDFALAPVRDRPGLRALDLGAGTGKLTRLLTDRGVDTVAVEPAGRHARGAGPGGAGGRRAGRLAPRRSRCRTPRSTWWWPGRRSTGSTGPGAAGDRPGAAAGRGAGASSTTPGTTRWPGCGRCRRSSARPATTPARRGDYCRRTSARCSGRPSVHRTTHEQPLDAGCAGRPGRLPQLRDPDAGRRAGPAAGPGGRAGPDAPGAGRPAALLDAVRDHGRALPALRS